MKEMKATSAPPPKKNIKHMHGNILYICDFWVDPVVHLLLHGQGLTSVLGLYNNRCLWSKSTSNRRPCPQSCNQKSNLLPKNIFSFLRDINPASFKLAFTNKITISPILLILSCSSLSLSAIISTDQLSIKIFLTHSCLFIEVTIRFEGCGNSSVDSSAPSTCSSLSDKELCGKCDQMARLFVLYLAIYNH